LFTCCWAHARSKARQQPCIQLVRLGWQPLRLGKGAHAPQLNVCNWQPSLVAGFHQQLLIAAGGLKDNQCRPKLLEARHELCHLIGGVLDVLHRRIFAVTKSNIEMILRDVNADTVWLICFFS